MTLNWRIQTSDIKKKVHTDDDEETKVEHKQLETKNENITANTIQ